MLPLAGASLNPFLALGRRRVVGAGRDASRGRPEGAELVPLADLEARLPIAVGDYVDFYSSLEHATNLGRMFRPDGRAAAAELPAPAGRLPRPRELGRRLGYAGTSSARPAPARGPPTFGPTAAARHRARARLRHRPRQRPRQPIRPTRRATRLRLRARQRLERARHPALGVPAARTVPRQVVRDLGLALDRAAGGAEPFRVPRAAGSAPLAVPRTDQDWALDIALEVELAAR